MRLTDIVTKCHLVEIEKRKNCDFEVFVGEVRTVLFIGIRVISIPDNKISTTFANLKSEKM